MDLPGWFYEPTVLVDVPEDARIHREEIFGPVVLVVPSENEAEMVRRANDSQFGLAASVWTRDAERARRVSRRLDVGTVWTNDFGYSYAACQASWAGRKESGFGDSANELSRVGVAARNLRVFRSSAVAETSLAGKRCSAPRCARATPSAARRRCRAWKAWLPRPATSSTSCWCGTSGAWPATRTRKPGASGGVLGRSRAEHATLPASLPGLAFAP